MGFLKRIFQLPIWANLLLIAVTGFAILYLVYSSLNSFTRHGEKVTVPMVEKLTLDQAEEVLDDLHLNYEIIDSAEYNPKLPRFAIVSQSPKEGVNIKRGRTVFVKINPSGYKKIPFPNVIGKTKRIALTYFDILGFKVGKTTTVKDISRDVVMRAFYNGKELKGGEKLPKNSVIDIEISEPMEIVYFEGPNLLGMNYYQALKVIDSMNLTLSPINADIPVGDSSRAIVYRQSPDPRIDIATNDFISIWITNDTALYNREYKAWKVREQERLEKLKKYNIEVDSIVKRSKVGAPSINAKVKSDSVKQNEAIDF